MTVRDEEIASTRFWPEHLEMGSIKIWKPRRDWGGVIVLRLPAHKNLDYKFIH